jgi:hypothetical protein
MAVHHYRIVDVPSMMGRAPAKGTTEEERASMMGRAPAEELRIVEYAVYIKRPAFVPLYKASFGPIPHGIASRSKSITYPILHLLRATLSVPDRERCAFPGGTSPRAAGRKGATTTRQSRDPAR